MSQEHLRHTNYRHPYQDTLASHAVLADEEEAALLSVACDKNTNPQDRDNLRCDASMQQFYQDYGDGFTA